MPRPRIRCASPSSRRTLGEPACSVKLPSLDTESMPATNSENSHVDQNGTVSARRRLLDAGHRLRALQRAARALRSAECESHLDAAPIEPDPEQPIGVVTEADVLHVDQAAEEQSGADEQHHRERGLRDQQSDAQRASAAPCPSRDTRLERRRDVALVPPETPARVPSAVRPAPRARRRR